MEGKGYLNKREGGGIWKENSPKETRESYTKNMTKLQNTEVFIYCLCLRKFTGNRVRMVSVRVKWWEGSLTANYQEDKVNKDLKEMFYFITAVQWCGESGRWCIERID